MDEKILEEFAGRRLRGGFTVTRFQISPTPLTDAIGREAIARTYVIGRQFLITIRAGLSSEELSVTIYHEILEAATVASADPPEAVRNFNEANFEHAAYQALATFGTATPVSVDSMLQFYGF